MFLHGSRNELNVGDVLLPGNDSTVNKNDNGGKSNHVYLVMTDGFSLTECEDGEGYDNAFEFAVSEALWWGGDKFVYIVEPLSEISYDDNHDVSPACIRAEKAMITAKYDSSDYCFDDFVKILRAKG